MDMSLIFINPKYINNSCVLIITKTTKTNLQRGRDPF